MSENCQKAPKTGKKLNRNFFSPFLGLYWCKKVIQCFIAYLAIFDHLTQFLGSRYFVKR